jgi:plasmid stabilization system protein ParE
MRYTVLWKPAAEQELASIWTSASDRDDITAAANRIDKLLQSDAEQRGESRSAGIRILVVPPLGVLFTVEPDDRIVNVGTVWRFTKRDKDA